MTTVDVKGVTVVYVCGLWMVRCGVVYYIMCSVLSGGWLYKGAVGADVSVYRHFTQRRVLPSRRRTNRHLPRGTTTVLSTLMNQ